MTARIIYGMLLCALLQGESLRVTGGLRDWQVLQRGAATTISGEGGGAVEVRVLSAKGPIRGFGWRKVADARAGHWSFAIAGLPPGGPYRVELRSGSAKAAVEHVLVGDLWVLAGQSNMQGDGLLENAVRGHELVHSFGMSDEWARAEEPLHALEGAVDPVHRIPVGRTARTRGAGLGLPFAKEMVSRTGVPVGLIPCAHSGTAIAEWSPSGKERGGQTLYGSMYRRIHAAGGRVAGVLWYQGEADAKPGLAGVYGARFRELIDALRRDLENPELPFYYVQLGRNVSDANVAEWNQVQETQRMMEDQVGNGAMAASIDLELEDAIHIGTEGLQTLGRRLALLATRSGVRGPSPLKAEAGDRLVRLRLANVNGRIVESGRLAGFSCVNKDGRVKSRIYRVRVDPNDGTTLLLYFDDGPIPPAQIWYGRGKDPYCNIRDSAGMALPAFGPLEVEP